MIIYFYKHQALEEIPAHIHQIEAGTLLNRKRPTLAVPINRVEKHKLYNTGTARLSL
jgi:hypothetical protein